MEYIRKMQQNKLKHFAERGQGRQVQETFSCLDQHFSLTHLRVGAQCFSVSTPKHHVSDIAECSCSRPGLDTQF